jgi:hypothetical protein
MTNLDDWVSAAPRRFALSCVSSVAQVGENVAPALTLAFIGKDVEPVTVTLVNSELNLRRFQKELGRALDEAIREARRLARG